MEILYLPKFKKQYEKLQPEIKDLAEEKEKISVKIHLVQSSKPINFMAS